jgi:hypothetical protein
MSITNRIESQFSDDNNLKPDRNSAGYHDHSHDVSFFQICQSCFWCTSTLNATSMIKICLVCTSEGIDSLPISPNEVYSYGVSKSANPSLSFNPSIPKYKERETILFQNKRHICKLWQTKNASTISTTSSTISTIPKEIGELIYNELWLLLCNKMT